MSENCSGEMRRKQIEDRNRYVELILRSSAKNKIIVAGAGTGKSFIFKKLLETKKGNNLALTFINNLARDLQKKLGELAEAYTFHGYCKKLLHKIVVAGIDATFNYFPKLPQLIKVDAEIIGNSLNGIEEAFYTLTEDGRIEFYLERGDYYNAVGHTDAVYRVLKHFQAGEASLPSFCQVVVDEYQDFNALEVSFIDELAKKSPVLISGDDDQAIYDFKKASPDHVRSKASHPDFKKFELPYCSRCTQVIVDAIYDITSKAKILNKLRGRIEKNYFCFLPDKGTDSARYPQIIHASCSTHTSKAPYISKFIEKEIALIPQEEINCVREDGYPCVLIAGPSHYTKQIYNYLKTKTRFTNIDYRERQDQPVEILEGYKILIRDKESNLGWRIILECSGLVQKEKIIKDSYESKQKLNDMLGDSFKNPHLAIVAILEKIKAGEKISEAQVSEVVVGCGRLIEEIIKILGAEETTDREEEEISEDASAAIKITTINGSKGLSANYVFLVGLNDGDFPRNGQNPTDNEICQFIVGLTRTRKKCYLVSNGRFGAACKKKSVFIDWIDSSRIDKIVVDANYFRTENSVIKNSP